MAASLTDLAKAFNALPRPTNAASRRSAKAWNFSIIYWHIEPNPCHVLLLCQPETDIAHMTRLPLDVSSNEPGYAFFPETAQAAAPEIVRGLLQFFINPRYTDMQGNEKLRPPTPRNFTTPEESLARAVEAVLGRLGVWPPTLHTVDISSKMTEVLIYGQFAEVFTPEVDRKIGEGRYTQKPHIYVPGQILFDEHSPKRRDDTEGISDEEKHDAWVAAYEKLFHSVTPPDGTRTRGRSACKSKRLRCLRISKLLREFPAQRVRAAADSGNSRAATDYGIRLLHGIYCNPSRDLARQYFLKAAQSDTASDKEQAIAHGLLCEWYWDGVIMPYDPNTSQRYLFAACHHANKSADLCKRVSPPSAFASSAVLSSLGSMADPDARQNDARLFYPHSLRAYEEHELKEKESRQELVKKRYKRLNRYRCAAEDCDIETDSGYMLFRCAGACDKDKKPSYCSRTCQKDDWDVHKPFCCEGAPCSVTKPDDFGDVIVAHAPARERGAGLLFLPMIHPDGSATLLGTGTLEPDGLYDLEDDLLERGRNPGSFYLLDMLEHYLM